MTPTTLTRDEIEGVDDMGRFADGLTERDVDRAIEAKCRRFDVEILRGGIVVAKELNVRAETGLAAAQQVMARTPGNYGFRPVAQ